MPPLNNMGHERFAQALFEGPTMGMPVHVVAERCGHDPAVLLRVLRQNHQKGGHERSGNHREAHEGRDQLARSRGLGRGWVEIVKCCRGVPFGNCAKPLILLRRKGGRVV